MYKYYLGAFGNKSYIRPQFEILEGGNLRTVGDDRWTEFPNGGTVSISSYLSDNDVDDIKNRLLKFKIDFNKDLHPGFVLYSENSNKYQIRLSNIEELDREEIIEIIDIDCEIDEFLNDKAKRIIRIKHRPNKLILLRYGQDCYGPFEFMISEIEDSYANETFYTLKFFVSSGAINKYKFFELEDIILEGNFSIKRSERLQFIYKLDKLKAITPTEEIDYFDNEELSNFLGNLLDKTDEIENIVEIREKFLQIADTFSEKEKLSDRRIQRICDLLQTSVELSDYKFRITEEYFKHNPNAQKDKEEYLRKHDELLDRIVREDIHYDEKTKELYDELSGLQEHKDNLIREIEERQKKLDDQQAELEKLGEQAVAQRKQDLENLFASQKKKLEDVKAAIEKAKQECKQEEAHRDFWKEQCDSLREECNTITNDINAKIIEWATENRNTEIIRLLVTQLEMPEEELHNVIPQSIDNLRDDLDANQIAEILCEKLAQAGRSLSKDEAYNYLISIVQNYITVFAGEPGTGKTSLCKLLAKALGIYKTRFTKILVERGWTSSKDLIGYYNPLTREIEKTQPAFSDCMQQLDLENANNLVEAPYFVLLDEANLSPIEFYWSHFNYYHDNPKHQEVSYSNGERYEFGAELKFLATINYDQTTADLSPRFLDRAWVISLNPVSVDAIMLGLDEDTADNNQEIISLDCLNRAFDWRKAREKKMNQIIKSLLNEIVSKMKEGNHIISARSILAIKHYYLVAEEYMSSKEVALDYAISQKILPCISGNGKKYGDFLNELMSICKENELNKSAGIIAKIIDRSEHEFYSFFSL